MIDEKTRKEIDGEVWKHIYTERPGWKSVMARFPGVSEKTFFRIVKECRQRGAPLNRNDTHFPDGTPIPVEKQLFRRAEPRMRKSYIRDFAHARELRAEALKRPGEDESVALMVKASQMRLSAIHELAKFNREWRELPDED